MGNSTRIFTVSSLIYASFVIPYIYKDTLSITHPSSTAILIHCIDLHTKANRWLSVMFISCCGDIVKMKMASNNKTLERIITCNIFHVGFWTKLCLCIQRPNLELTGYSNDPQDYMGQRLLVRVVSLGWQEMSQKGMHTKCRFEVGHVLFLGAWGETG